MSARRALWLIAAFNGDPAYREDWNAATAELRNALKLPTTPPRPE